MSETFMWAVENWPTIVAYGERILAGMGAITLAAIGLARLTPWKWDDAAADWLETLGWVKARRRSEES